MSVWQTVLDNWLPGDPYQPELGTRETYRAKAAICEWVKPRTVLEIGVRAGYSAIAMYQGHKFEAYLGIDADSGLWGGEVGFCEHAKKWLSQQEGLSWEIHIQDSHSFKKVTVNGEPFDLAHVDGDHSAEGALLDIELCLNSGVRYIAVDDYDFIPDVRAAVVRAIQAHNLESRYFGDGGYRGTMVLWRPETGAP